MKGRFHVPKRGRLERTAERVVAQVMRRMPEAIRTQAEACQVVIGWGEELGIEPDLLGWFTGRSRLDGEPTHVDEMPEIVLVADHLWEFSDHRADVYEHEIATTFLHELGHYLGLDEDDILERGLD